MSTPEKRNPGATIFDATWCGLLIFILGGVMGSPDEQPHVALLWVAGVVFVVFGFIAAVVGAYYAGKKKRD